MPKCMACHEEGYRHFYPVFNCDPYYHHICVACYKEHVIDINGDRLKSCPRCGSNLNPLYDDYDDVYDEYCSQNQLDMGQLIEFARIVTTDKQITGLTSQYENRLITINGVETSCHSSGFLFQSKQLTKNKQIHNIPYRRNGIWYYWASSSLMNLAWQGYSTINFKRDHHVKELEKIMLANQQLVLDFTEEKNMLEEQMLERDSIITNLREELQRLHEEELPSRDSMITDSESQIQKLNNEITQKDTELQQQIQENQKLLQELTEFNQNVVTEIREACAQQISQIQQQCFDQIQEIQQQNEQYVEQINEAESMVNQMRGHNYGLMAQIDILTEENKTQKETAEQLYEMIDKIEKYNQQLVTKSETDAYNYKIIITQLKAQNEEHDANQTARDKENRELNEKVTKMGAIVNEVCQQAQGVSKRLEETEKRLGETEKQLAQTKAENQVLKRCLDQFNLQDM